MTFNAPGQVVITLTAANAAGVTGTAQVTINVVTENDHNAVRLQHNPSPDGDPVAQGNSVTMTVTVNFISGTPQPVQLSVSGLPNGVKASFSSNSVTPTATVTLTIMAAYNTQAGQTYTLTISGSGGGTTNTATLLIRGLRSGMSKVPRVSPRQYRTLSILHLLQGIAKLEELLANKLEVAPGIKPDISDPCKHQCAQRVIDHRLIVDWKQMLTDDTFIG